MGVSVIQSLNRMWIEYETKRVHKIDAQNTNITEIGRHEYNFMIWYHNFRSHTIFVSVYFTHLFFY